MIEKALTAFSGVKRRQEIIARSAQSIYISDFAHHPTAIDKTLQALAEHYPQRKLLAVFEPRTATSRQALFQDELAAAFGAADEVMGIPAVAAANVEDIFARITSRSNELQLVVIMSTGDFGGLFDRIQEL